MVEFLRQGRHDQDGRGVVWFRLGAGHQAVELVRLTFAEWRQ
jgi:hypothetical protein